MKLSNQYWNILTNFQEEYEKEAEKLKVTHSQTYAYFGRSDIIKSMEQNLFELEDRDFERAILLCKEYKRSIQKKSYELKFNQFKEGTLRGGKTNFISDLYWELRGNRRTNGDKIELIDNSMKELFPERQEIECANTLFDVIVSHFKQIRELEREEKRLEELNVLVGTILIGHQEGKSVLEVRKEVRSRQAEQENG